MNPEPGWPGGDPSSLSSEDESFRSDEYSDGADTSNARSPMYLGASSPTLPIHLSLPDTFAADLDDVHRALCRVNWVIHADIAERLFTEAARQAEAQSTCVQSHWNPDSAAHH